MEPLKSIELSVGSGVNVERYEPPAHKQSQTPPEGKLVYVRPYMQLIAVVEGVGQVGAARPPSAFTTEVKKSKAKYQLSRSMVGGTLDTQPHAVRAQSFGRFTPTIVPTYEYP